METSYDKYINWKEFFKIFGCMVSGMVVGIWIYNRFPLNQLLIFYGVMIMIIALKKMFIKEKKEKTIPIWAGILILLAAGIIHGMFVSGGALLVIYAAAVLKDKQEFRATVALIWVTTGCYITGTQVVTGNFNSHVIWLLLIGIIPVFAGTVRGTNLVKRIPQEIFMKLTLSDNPLKAGRQKIKDIIVEKTIKDGVELYKRI